MPPTTIPARPDSPDLESAITGRGRRRAVVAATVASIAGVAWVAAEQAGLTQAALLIIAVGMGVAIGHSGFGFAGAWRSVLVEGRGGGFRAQLALLALLTVFFFPLFGSGGAFGLPVGDILRPVGLSLVAGAFIFGIGAQLASACSSGSFCALGDAKLRYLIVLASMVVGATLGSAHFGWWESQSQWVIFSMVRDWGPLPAMAANLGIIGVIAGITIILERARHGSLASGPATRTHWIKGPWPIWRGVVILALLCTATLLLSGRPWTIISALPLWGAHLIEATALPFDVIFWDYWAAGTRADALDGSLWLDVTTVMIIGLVLGSALAAALAGRLKAQWRIRPHEALRAVTGGLLLGYGGVVGLGCNIGAFLGGVASGSLHGWFWLAAALAGTAFGIGILAATNAALNLVRGTDRRLAEASASG